MQSEEYKKSWLCGYFLLLLTPLMLVWSRGAADGIVVIISVLFVFRSIRTKKFDWLQDRFLQISLLSWLWLVLVVSPFSYAPLTSFENAVIWIRYILFYAAIRHWLLTSRQPILYITILLTALLGFCAIDTLVQYITGISLTQHKIDDSGRLTGPMDNVKIGIFMAKLLFPTAGLLLFFASNRSLKTIISALGFVLFCYIIILLSGERTAFAVSSVSMVTAVLMLAISDKKLRPICIWLFLATIIGMSILFYTQDWLHKRVQHTINNLSDFKDSSYGQLFWVGYDLGKNNLLTGVGLKEFRELCLPYLASEQVNHCNLHPHNPYIEWFSEAGIIGFLFFVAMISMLLREGIKFFSIEKNNKKIIPAAAIATCIMNFFPLAATQSFFSNWPAIVLWFGISVAFSANNLLEETKT